MNQKSQNFMSLPKKECLSASKVILENAIEKYEEAQFLAKRNSYGTASSLLITGMEESIKSLILVLDANGFQFRMKVKNMSSVFKNHSMRYEFGFLLTVSGIFYKDFLKIVNHFMSGSNVEFPDINPVKVNQWCKVRISQIKRELLWFDQIGFFREKGLYVDVDGQIIKPSTISKIDFDFTAQRVSRVIEMIKSLHEICDNESNRVFLSNLSKRFFSDDWYVRISNWTKKSHRDDSFFIRSKEFILEMQELVHDEELLELMIENYEEMKRSWNQKKESGEF